MLLVLGDEAGAVLYPGGDEMEQVLEDGELEQVLADQVQGLDNGKLVLGLEDGELVLVLEDGTMLKGRIQPKLSPPTNCIADFFICYQDKLFV